MRINSKEDTHRSRELKLALVMQDVRMSTFNPFTDRIDGYKCLIQDTLYYRVSIGKPYIEVLSLDLENVDDDLNGVYDDLSDLPTWMQERIAMLSMLSFTPPTETVPGVGRRISEVTYWVEKPDSCS